VKLPLLALVLALLTGCHRPSYTDDEFDVPPACDAALCPSGDAVAQTVGGDAARPDANGADPYLPSDAGTTGDVSRTPDAAPDQAAIPATPGASAPPEAEALSGTYAVRARWYARDSSQIVAFTHEMVWLATIRFDEQAGAIKMDAQLCADEGDIVSTIPTSTFVRFPERLPSRTYNIVLNGGVFTAIGAPLAMGYDADPPVPCKAGQRVAASPLQVWNKDGLCDCALSDSLPTTVSDCRVTDPDTDMQPGIAVDLKGGLNTYNSVRVRESSQFVNGLIRADKKHTAELFKDEQYYVLACKPDTCSNAVYTYCPSKFHPVEFVPLGAAEQAPGFSCRDAIAARGQFSNVPRSFPSGC